MNIWATNDQPVVTSVVGAAVDSPRVVSATVVAASVVAASVVGASVDPSVVTNSVVWSIKWMIHLRLILQIQILYLSNRMPMKLERSRSDTRYCCCHMLSLNVHLLELFCEDELVGSNNLLLSFKIDVWILSEFSH